MGGLLLVLSVVKIKESFQFRGPKYEKSKYSQCQDAKNNVKDELDMIFLNESNLFEKTLTFHFIRFVF